MKVPRPAAPRIYHIIHWNRLESVIEDGRLWCDSELRFRPRPGTPIGMPEIKRRRLQNRLDSQPGLAVGECVPFYFCPRAVMLYVIHRANHPQLSYRGGQEPIVRLEADLNETVEWADRNGRRWAFTLSNAGSSYFEDRCVLAQLDEIDREAVTAVKWQHCREQKQAEFLVEESFPWTLVRRVGTCTSEIQGRMRGLVRKGDHRPEVEVRPDWYY